jgi:hypothetical protein
MLSPLLLGLGLLQAGADVAQVGFGMVIASDSDCPSAAAIREEMASLKYPTPDAASVAVHADDDEVSITFGAPGGVQRGPRQLALPPECPRRAATVALLIAAWLGRIPSGPPTALTVVGEPPPPRPAPEPPGREHLELAAGLSAYLQAGHLIPALRLELGAGTEGSGPGWQLGAVLPTPVQHRTGVGQVRWMRPAVFLGRRIRKVSPGVSLDATVGALLGATFAWGQGYPVNQHDAGLAAGGTAALRLCAYPGGVGPWIELRGRGWLVEQELAWIGRTADDSVILPVIEIELTFGASLPL